jgi:hypothetical protein
MANDQNPASHRRVGSNHSCRPVARNQLKATSTSAGVTTGLMSGDTKEVQIAQRCRRFEVSFDESRPGATLGVPQFVNDRTSRQSTFDRERASFDVADIEDLRQRERRSGQHQFIDQALAKADAFGVPVCVEDPQDLGIVKGVDPGFATVTEQPVGSDAECLQNNDKTGVVGILHLAHV